MSKKIGLVLGGGASRGFAHLGVLKVFEENHIPIDLITGCSMGAIIGGLYAAGSDIDILSKYSATFDMKKYMDFSIKTGGFIKGRKVEGLIKLLTKNMSIEQAKVPFACVAVDVCTGELKTFTKGPMYKAIRASISMPGIFEPYRYGSGLYIDGGVLDRLPMQTARDMGADIVIAVDVAERDQVKPPPKNLIETLRWTLSITDWNFTKHRLDQADLVLVPDVFEIDPMTNKECELCIQRGREAAEAALEDIRRLVIKEDDDDPNGAQ